MIFRQHPDVRFGITFNSKAYIIGEYLNQRQQIPFNLIGYDLVGTQYHLSERRKCYVLIAQQPELQGLNGIKTLCDHLILKKEVTCINYMPIDLLTAEKH